MKYILLDDIDDCDDLQPDNSQDQQYDLDSLKAACQLLNSYFKSVKIDWTRCVTFYCVTCKGTTDLCIPLTDRMIHWLANQITLVVPVPKLWSYAQRKL